MAHVGKEATLCLVCLLRQLFRLAQLKFHLLARADITQRSCHAVNAAALVAQALSTRQYPAIATVGTLRPERRFRPADGPAFRGDKPRRRPDASCLSIGSGWSGARTPQPLKVL